MYSVCKRSLSGLKIFCKSVLDSPFGGSNIVNKRGTQEVLFVCGVVQSVHCLPL